MTHWISQQPQTPLTPNFPSNPSVVYVPVQPIVSPLVAPLQGFFIPPSPGPVTSLSPPSTSPPYHPLMFFGQQGAMAHGWRQQTSDTRMSRAGRGSGYGPGRGGVRFSSHRGIRDNGWWDRDFDDGKPRNPWKKVDVYANKVTVGDVEDWPMVGSTNIGQVETQPTPAVERKERKPGMLHLPLNAVTSVNVEERPHSYSQALRTETMVIKMLPNICVLCLLSFNWPFWLFTCQFAFLSVCVCLFVKYSNSSLMKYEGLNSKASS